MEVKGTLKYRKVQRTPQTGENAGKKKWYAAAVTDREVDFEGFVSHISDHGSPYSRGTIHGVLMDRECKHRIATKRADCKITSLSKVSIILSTLKVIIKLKVQRSKYK